MFHRSALCLRKMKTPTMLFEPNGLELARSARLADAWGLRFHDELLSTDSVTPIPLKMTKTIRRCLNAAAATGPEMPIDPICLIFRSHLQIVFLIAKTG
jgi:hypothetical protein